jgi:hypothetical protein
LELASSSVQYAYILKKNLNTNQYEARAKNQRQDINKYMFNHCKKMCFCQWIGDWGLGIGDWGLGTGDWVKFSFYFLLPSAF